MTGIKALPELTNDRTVLPKDILEQYKKAEDVVEQISDAVDIRVGFIFSRIVAESYYNITKPKNTYLPRWDKVDPYPPHYLPNSDDFFSSIPMLKNQLFHYATYWFANPPIRFNIILDNGTTIDLFKMFPTSWLYDENFWKELIAGRDRFVDEEKRAKKDLQEKQNAEAEAAKKQEVIINNLKTKLTEEELQALGLK